MAGTVKGGKKAAATNKQRYGLNFYPQIGRKGGKVSRGGGFSRNRDLAREMGAIGGKWSRDFTEAEWAEEVKRLREQS
jgi:general stress protein YciG